MVSMADALDSSGFSCLEVSVRPQLLRAYRLEKMRSINKLRTTPPSAEIRVQRTKLPPNQQPDLRLHNTEHTHCTRWDYI